MFVLSVIEKFIDWLETKINYVDPSIVSPQVQLLKNNYFKAWATDAAIHKKMFGLSEAKEQKGGFLRMLLGTLGASLLGNLLTGKRATATS